MTTIVIIMMMLMEFFGGILCRQFFQLWVFPREIRVAFPEESQLQHNCATQPLSKSLTLAQFLQKLARSKFSNRGKKQRQPKAFVVTAVWIQ